MSTVSTIAPTTTSSTASPPHGTCRLHILEASLNYDKPLNVVLNLTAGDNAPTISQNYTIEWGDGVSIQGSLPYEVTVDFLLLSADNETTSADSSGVSAYSFEYWPILLTAGKTRWTNDQNDSSKLPYCKVGGWDNGNFGNTIDYFTSLGSDNYVFVSFLRGTICTYVYANFGTIKNRTAKWTVTGVVRTA
jgi:hypothetical protein